MTQNPHPRDPFGFHHREFARFWLLRKGLNPAEPWVQGLAFLAAAYERGPTALDEASAQELWNEIWLETAPDIPPPAYPGLDDLPGELFLSENSPLVRVPLPDGRVFTALRKVYQREAELVRLWTPLWGQSPPWDSTQVSTDAPGWSKLNPGQQQAVAGALQGRFFLLTGGPGTGKTTTIFQILVQILDRCPPIRIALGAPTGRAAARIGESLAQETSRLADGELKNRLMDLVPLTLHRLLGLGGDLRPPKHHGENPLPFELVIVDEFSMVDLVLCRRLLRALAPGCALILAGDSDQLPSVEPGAVLQEILTVAPIQARTVRLTVNQRVLGAGSGDSAPLLDRLFRTLRDTEARAAVSVLRDLEQPEVFTWLPLDDLWTSFLGDMERSYGPGPLKAWTHLCQLEQPDEDARIPLLLNDLRERILLSPVRKGPWGVETLNAHLAVLAVPGRTPGVPVYPGLPWMINRNIGYLELNNGDRGLVVRRSGRLFVAFPAPGNRYRIFPFALVSEDGEPSWAMTVHKSQGSEFHRVFLAAPPSPGGDRKLLYTGATRARNAVRLFGEEKNLVEILGRNNRRGSLLSPLMSPIRPSPLG